MAHPRNRADRQRIEALKASRRASFIRARFELDTTDGAFRSKLLGYTQLLDRCSWGYSKPLDKAPLLKDQDY